MRPVYFPFHFAPPLLHESNQKAENFSWKTEKEIDKKVKIWLLSWIWSLSISLSLPGVDQKNWKTIVLFHLKKKKWGRKGKISQSLWLQGQLHTCTHSSIKSAWCYISVCSAAVQLYGWRHKPVNSGFIARSARCTVQELKHTSLCHQPKRPHQGFPLLLSQFSHLIDSCSHTVSAMASLCDFFAFDKDGIVYNNIHVS